MNMNALAAAMLLTFSGSAAFGEIRLPLETCYCDGGETAVCPDGFQVEAAFHFPGGYLGDSRYNFIPSRETLVAFPGSASFYASVFFNEADDTVTFIEERSRGSGPVTAVELERCEWWGQ